MIPAFRCTECQVKRINIFRAAVDQVLTPCAPMCAQDPAALDRDRFTGFMVGRKTRLDPSFQAHQSALAADDYFWSSGREGAARSSAREERTSIATARSQNKLYESDFLHESVGYYHYQSCAANGTRSSFVLTPRRASENHRMLMLVASHILMLRACEISLQTDFFCFYTNAHIFRKQMKQRARA